VGGSGSEAGSRGSVEMAKAGSAMKPVVAREASGGKGGDGAGPLACQWVRCRIPSRTRITVLCLGNT